MNQIIVVALICAASVQAPDCSRETALDVAVAPVFLEAFGQLLL